MWRLFPWKSFFMTRKVTETDLVLGYFIEIIFNLFVPINNLLISKAIHFYNCCPNNSAYYLNISFGNVKFSSTRFGQNLIIIFILDILVFYTIFWVCDSLIECYAWKPTPWNKNKNLFIIFDLKMKENHSFILQV